MVRHTDTETTVTKEDFTHSSLEAGGLACHAELPREAPKLARRHRDGMENVGKSFNWRFHEK